MERYGSQGRSGRCGLLTLRTAELIEEADVIVYDALLSAEILSRIPRETETIYVGKHAETIIRFLKKRSIRFS